jgi:hypothetical protein
MTAYAGDKPILVIKKLGALIFLLFAFLLTATGFNSGSTGLAIVGSLMLVAGTVLLILKIVRRNQGDRL